MKIFSGIQPTGKLHIGNYFGAIQNMVRLQDEGEAIFSIVDLHAITVEYEPGEMKENTLETVLDFLASGIDPEKSIVFIQSHIKEHAELANLLQNITPLGELQRMTQFKDKAQKAKSINAGLLMYPVLQAADILLYDTDLVPVGVDQKQHLELTQNIVRRFNNRFGDIFVSPNFKIPEDCDRIMSLVEPSRKMSKSEPEGCIFITDTPEEIKRKIKKAVTDSEKGFDNIENRVAVRNLITIYEACEGKDSFFAQKFESHAEFKEALVNVLIKKLEPVRKRREELEKKPEYIQEALKVGSEKAQVIASKKMREIKKAMGLI